MPGTGRTREVSLLSRTRVTVVPAGLSPLLDALRAPILSPQVSLLPTPSSSSLIALEPSTITDAMEVFHPTPSSTSSLLEVLLVRKRILTLLRTEPVMLRPACSLFQLVTPPTSLRVTRSSSRPLSTSSPSPSLSIASMTSWITSQESTALLIAETQQLM